MSDPVYDRGPREHAMGTVSGSYYTVAAGDTFYSIGLRFGLPSVAFAEGGHRAPSTSRSGAAGRKPTGPLPRPSARRCPGEAPYGRRNPPQRRTGFPLAPARCALLAACSSP